MCRIPILLLLLSLTGCATTPEPVERAARITRSFDPPERFEGGPLALTITPPALRDDAALVQAELEASELLGLLDISTRYGVLPGNRALDPNTVGRQRLAQEFGTRLPLPFGSPLRLGVSSQIDQRLTSQGVLPEQTRSLKARWNEGELRFALDARQSDAAIDGGCMVDASLSAPTPEELHLYAAEAKGLRLGGQLCDRTLPGALPQEARIVSASTAWDDVYGARRLRVSHASVRESHALGRAPGESTVELGASHAIELAGFSLSQEVALRSAHRREQAAGWAAKSELRRKIYRVPVTASWQRHDASIWSLGGAQPAGYETSLGFDLSAPLQQWLSRHSGASLSYHRLSPDDRNASLEEQLRLGVSLGW